MVSIRINYYLLITIYKVHSQTISTISLEPPGKYTKGQQRCSEVDESIHERERFNVVLTSPERWIASSTYYIPWMLSRQHCWNNAEIAMLNSQRLANVDTLTLNLEQVNVTLTLDSKLNTQYISWLL